jgi:diacylglycerol O-acyltransferase / wax synthase
VSAAKITRLRTDELAYAWMDSRRTPMQIALLGVLDAARFSREGRLDVDRVRADLAERARRVPQLSRRVRWTRPGQGRPAWVADAADPLAQISLTTLPPGADLPRWAATRAVRPLDRDRPLWRIEVVDGLPGDRFAVLAVLHHVLADGLAAVALLTQLLDAGPDAEPDPAPVPPPLPQPTARQLVAAHLREVGAVLRPRPAAPGDAARAGPRRLREVLADFRHPEPAVPLPRRIGTGRRLAVVRHPLDDVRRTAHALGVTVNDVLLTAVTSGVRELLAAGGVDPAGLVLRTTVPTATGGPGQVMALMVVGLPVGEPDPVRQLAQIHGTTAAAKARLRVPGGDVTGMRLPAPLARWVLLAARSWGSRRVTLSVTDVPGPPAPLWLGGARLLEAVPIAPLVPHVPLAVAALSYAGELVVSVQSDDRVTDVGVLADGVAGSLTGLRELARAGAGT